MARHGAGEFDRAARFYARALRLVPEEPNALNLSGVLARQQGDAARAAALTARALALRPDSPVFLASHGA